MSTAVNVAVWGLHSLFSGLFSGLRSYCGRRFQTGRSAPLPTGHLISPSRSVRNPDHGGITKQVQKITNSSQNYYLLKDCFIMKMSWQYAHIMSSSCAVFKHLVVNTYISVHF